MGLPVNPVTDASAPVRRAGDVCLVRIKAKRHGGTVALISGCACRALLFTGLR
jgi:hypothetical protein